MPKIFRRRSFAVMTVAVLIGGSASVGWGADSGEIDPRGLIVLMRHAEAPGVGDPPNFQLRDCATQRNLGASGREQARRVGDRLRSLGVQRAAVYSSQWCRCLETARLLDVGSVQELPVLNSFFDRREAQDAQIASLRRFLAGLPAGGAPVVLVTHQVVVTALTGVYPASGESVLLRADGTENPTIEGRIQTDGSR
ncbi:histidine phosphatase family protein [Azospirillum formosense]|uniref:Histidine phosphatase family protein n=2 Tax=Azospirillum formosense TaxID=861533 RepID=A0ABX2KXN4_9PROT|nr:histidine phosphatase family protein [Azospirillum formosense]NUB20442.1 histidine phosphatase family protein [Azospirillum formosense]